MNIDENIENPMKIIKIMYNLAIEHNQSVQVVQSVSLKLQATFKKYMGFFGVIIYHRYHLFCFHGNPKVYRY